jgi:hypothetical protein
MADSSRRSREVERGIRSLFRLRTVSAGHRLGSHLPARGDHQHHAVQADVRQAGRSAPAVLCRRQATLGTRRLYQEGSVAAMRTPEELVRLYTGGDTLAKGYSHVLRHAAGARRYFLLGRSKWNWRTRYSIASSRMATGSFNSPMRDRASTA